MKAFRLFLVSSLEAGRHGSFFSYALILLSALILEIFERQDLTEKVLAVAGIELWTSRA